MGDALSSKRRISIAVLIVVVVVVVADVFETESQWDEISNFQHLSYNKL